MSEPSWVNKPIDNASWDKLEDYSPELWRERAIRQEMRAIDLKKQNDELKAQLEYCKESMCFHKGETRPGSNREWCFDCRSWVYPSDREMLAKIEGEK